MHSLHTYSGWRGDGLALLTGALLTLAFAPFSLWPLGIIALALLLSNWLTCTPLRSLWRGWIFGLGFFGTSVYWVFNSIHTFGHASIPLSCVITGGFISLLACFPALTGFFLAQKKGTSATAKSLWIFPVFWLLFEVLRSRAFTGFPWSLVGYSQINSPLRGFAPLISVYGVGFITVFCSALLLSAYERYRHHHVRNAIYYLIALAAMLLIGWSLTFITWTKPFKKPLQVSLIQGNIAQDLKWSPDHLAPTLKTYEDLTKQHWNSALIVWPESAVPILLQDVPEFIQHMSDEAAAHHTSLVTGIPVQANEPDTYYNAVIALGKQQSAYLKQQLVPFGEYLPFKTWLTRIIDKLDIPMSNFISGSAQQQPLTAAGLNIATFICYEVAYAQHNFTKNPAIQLAITVTNDAWFGDSIAKYQHLQIAQMRALEMGRPLLFVGNNGITAIIRPNGSLQATLPSDVTGVLTGMVQPYDGLTPWQRVGLDPLILVVFAVFIILRKRNAKKSKI